MHAKSCCILFSHSSGTRHQIFVGFAFAFVIKVWYFFIAQKDRKFLNILLFKNI